MSAVLNRVEILPQSGWTGAEIVGVDLREPLPEEHIDVIRRAVAMHNWQTVHPDEWIQANYVKRMGLTFHQGKLLLDEEGLGAYYPADKPLADVFQQIADGLFETGALSRKIDIPPYVDGRLNPIVQAQNRIDGVVPRALANDRRIDDGSNRPDSKPFVLR